MIPGCTSALDFELDDKTIDLTEASDIYVTIEQGETSIVASGERIEVDQEKKYKATAYFTQAETLRLRDGAEASVQINWLYTNLLGEVSRAASDPATITVGRQILRRVLP